MLKEQVQVESEHGQRLQQKQQLCSQGWTATTSQGEEPGGQIQEGK